MTLGRAARVNAYALCVERGPKLMELSLRPACPMFDDAHALTVGPTVHGSGAAPRLPSPDVSPLWWSGCLCVNHAAAIVVL